MNPRGILFGPNASLNTSGSLIATSADHLQLTDGGRFDALLPTADVLTTAPPSAFGFTAPHPAPITLQGSKLEVSADSKILMIGGDLTINGDNDASGDAQLAAAGGQIGLIGVGSAGDALFAADGMLIDVTGFTTLGDVKLQNTAVIDASGLGGGEVTVQGAGFTIDNATIQANTTGAEPGQGVTLALSGHLLMDNNGLIESSTTGDGQAGRIPGGPCRVHRQ